MWYEPPSLPPEDLELLDVALPPPDEPEELLDNVLEYANCSSSTVQLLSSMPTLMDTHLVK